MWSGEFGVWSLEFGVGRVFRVGRGFGLEEVSGWKRFDGFKRFRISGFQGFRVPFEDGGSGDWDEL